MWVSGGLIEYMFGFRHGERERVRGGLIRYMTG